MVMVMVGAKFCISFAHSISFHEILSAFSAVTSGQVTEEG